MSSPKLATFTVGMVILQFGLSVVGEGGVAAYCSHQPLVAMVIIGVALTAVSLTSQGNLSSGEEEARENRWVLPVFTLLGLASAYLPAYTDRIGFWTVDGESIRWFGVALSTAGSILRIWPVFVLGRRFSGLVAIQPGHALVTTGIYRHIRNPSYLGMLISMVGWALAFRALVGVLLTLLLLVPLASRMRAEEKLLRTHFGSSYEAYCARTARLIPWLY